MSHLLPPAECLEILGHLIQFAPARYKIHCSVGQPPFRHRKDMPRLGIGPDDGAVIAVKYELQCEIAMARFPTEQSGKYPRLLLVVVVGHLASDSPVAG